MTRWADQHRNTNANTEIILWSTKNLASTLRHTKKHSQGGQDQHDSEIDLDDHVKVLLCEPVHHLTQYDQHCSWQIYLKQKKTLIQGGYMRKIEQNIDKKLNLL